MLVDAIAAVRLQRVRLGLLGILGFAASCFTPTVAEPSDETGDETGDTTSVTTSVTTTAETTGVTTSVTTSVTMADGSTTAEDDATATAPSTTDDTLTSDITTGDPPECGDEVVEGDEECDDGPDNGETAACKPDCTLAFCGDGDVWDGMEECDDANDDDVDACLSTCIGAICGDGFVHAGMEDCDDAGESIVCDVDCTPPSCGDGLTNTITGEQCDDGDFDDDDACPTTCLDASCGDGFLYPAMETCDSGDLGGASCMDFGLVGDLACTAQCGLDTSNCYFVCPDGGALINNKCWYRSVGCDTTDVTCASHGLIGADGYTDSVWDMATMQAIANHYGWFAGGVIACCVEFAWVQDGAIYSHNFGAQFYNWGGCYDIYPTVKACNVP